jgi:hypothetical protein
VIEMRRKQLGFADGLIAEEVSDLREDWMKHADEVLADEEIVTIVYEALAKRHPKSRCRGRRGTPADTVLRLLILKHVRNWSYAVLEREVRANLVYRDFTRVGGGKMPDAKTMGRWGIAIRPQALKQIHERIVKIAQAKGVTTGRRMRVDTTVVETNVLRAAARKMLNAEHIVMRSPNCGTPQIGLRDDISLRITMATERRDQCIRRLEAPRPQFRRQHCLQGFQLHRWISSRVNLRRLHVCVTEP